MRGAGSDRVTVACTRTLVILSLVVICASGCAFWGDPTPPGFDKVALESEVERTDEGELEGDLHADTTVKNALIGGTAGAGTAAAVGAGAGALAATACGPFYAACLFPAMGFFALAFAPFGFVGGAFYGAIGGLPWATTEEVNAVLDRLEQRDFTAELQVAIVGAVPGEKQVPPGEAQATVTARIDEFDLHQHYSERLSLSLRASMIQEWDRHLEKPKSHTCEYEFRTPKRDVEDWLLQEGLAFDEAFTEGIGTIALWMARDLEAFATRVEQPETEDAPETCYQD